MTRTQTRELAFELLYSLEIQKVAKNEQTEQIQLFIEQQEIEEEKVKKYILETTRGIEEHEEEILKNIFKQENKILSIVEPNEEK